MGSCLKVPLLLCFIYYCLIIAVDGKEWPHLSKIQPSTAPVVQAAAVQDLVARLIPERQNEFQIHVDPLLSTTGRDTFRLLKKPGDARVFVTGSSGVAAAAGFNFYLKYSCHSQISWEANSQLSLPQELPQIDTEITSPDRFRYYQNVCTLGYSFIWWNWSQWERHLDWMALNGINLPLAFVGQEALWQRVWKRLGFEQNEINPYFSGPAFLPNRMGNMRGWGGPLPSSWNEKSLALQRQILDRMRDFGMTPVLPAFAGFVPRAIARVFPSANVTKMTRWNNFQDGFCCPYMLQPDDPLFAKIGALFLKEVIKEFGTNHIYNCDTFNEMEPTSGDEKYLVEVGYSTFSAMTSIDPDAIWMMQAWLFMHDSFWSKERAKALLTSVPTGRMLILDLQSELSEQFTRLDSYFGQPFIWCMLHNFGGTLGLYGAAQRVNQGVHKARKMPNNTMVGVGITPEGINQNYVIYDLMLENGWTSQPVNLTDWFGQYSKRRYGFENELAVKAWNLLLNSVYSFNLTNIKVRGKYVICRRPSFKLKPIIWYQPLSVAKSWDSLYELVPKHKNLSTLQHDFVDVTRQCLQLLGAFYHSQITKAYRKKNLPDLRKNGEMLLELFVDMDSVLASNEDFLMGKWIRDARSWGDNNKESDLYEFNARNQITLWGPQAEILDYANKQWSGVVNYYYKPRWQLFIQSLIGSLVSGESEFDQNTFNQQVFRSVEEPFTLDKKQLPIESSGDFWTVANATYSKWRPRFDRSAVNFLTRAMKRNVGQE
ncbi:alpha-N-acetylglucosaminidase isoform X2 [Neocloeon triangulifer]|uniref:alpha-N-acetylglucosaminidase isoform X2 n=1 Tax=Neocloeon triangulifer TaxID=2078957 RepID=UPI00286F318D|nr:alpha-N-acetylglucosaminidase isoform X2 [Neocloeon triangulifer]